jgi:hypothetical protein
MGMVTQLKNISLYIIWKYSEFSRQLLHEANITHGVAGLDGRNIHSRILQISIITLVDKDKLG